jgi:hypothetical protein
MMVEQQLREGDLVELCPDAPLPAHCRLQPGAQGRVVVAEMGMESNPTGEVSVQFGRGRTLRLHGHWLRFVSRPKRRGRPWLPPTAG